MLRRILHSTILALVLLLGVMSPAWARPMFDPLGVILSLGATDGPNPGDTISISSKVEATDKIEQSNFLYQIYAPDGVTIVETHKTELPRFDAGQTFSDSWSTSNSSFPSTGTYTVKLCWSTGNATNCNIGQAQTTFYSVPTLGWFLSAFGLGLVALWLWRQRPALTVRDL